MRLTFGAFSLELCEGNAQVTSLSFHGQELLSCRQSHPVFSLVALDENNHRVALVPADGRREGDSLVFDSMQAPDGPRRMQTRLSFREKDGAAEFVVRVQNQEKQLRVVETLFELCGLGFGEGGDTALLYPHHGGEKIVDPANALRSQRYQQFWRAGTALVNGEWQRECNYCGLCSMSYMYLQNKQAGLYFGSHDCRFPVTGLMVRTGEESRYLSLGFRIHKMIRPGEAWESGAFAVCLSDQDWHAGARRYRAWITPYLAQHENTEYLKEQAALNQCYNFKRVEEIQNRFEDIPRMWEEGNKRGINHMFIASWNRTGFDSFYPEYYPDMELGTALDFRRGMDYLNARGGFATLYVNARLSDMSSDFHRRFLSTMQIENANGEALTETYGPHSFTLNCPSDEKWQHMLVDICDFAAESYHLKGIYLDQLASAEPFACYHAGHSHHDIGEFNQGYLKILSELRERMRRRDPDSYLMTENCGDIYSAYTWGNLTWNGADYDEFYNMFRYTFPEYVQVNMCNDRSWAADDEERERCFYADVERCVLMGNILWIGITARYLDQPALKPHFDYLMAATAFRKAIAGQVSEGTYLDDEYVAAMDESLHASCFRVSERETLLLAGDQALHGGKVRFTLPHIAAHVEAFDEYGQPLSVLAEGNEVTLSMCGNRLARIHVQAGGGKA